MVSPPAPRPPRPRRRRLLFVLAAGLVSLVILGFAVYGGGGHLGPGSVGAVPRSEAALRRRDEAARAGGEGTQTRILFGDLHVHTTFSADAFFLSLPLLSGEGAHPPADACDFARYCSELDFFALTDHAESLTPEHWRETKESIRQCNAVAPPEAPDLVAFTGFEWSQVGPTRDTHYGHKNVIYRDVEEQALPPRPIASAGLSTAAMRGISDPFIQALVPVLEFPRRERYLDLAYYLRENAALADCPRGVDTRELPLDCREAVGTPGELFERLDQGGYEALVIPHGTTWGFYTPPGYVWDKQLDPAQDDPERQRLVEVYSGHGNSEEHRPFRAADLDASGEPRCPEPTDGYEPCCHRAGELVRARCGEASARACERRVGEARARYVRAGVAGHLTVPGASVEDWGECGQCTDCFAPSFSYRPGGSAQYMLARGRFVPGEEARHHTLGFIASSDNHSARPGTGYKEQMRRRMTEAAGPRDEAWRERIWGPRPDPSPESIALSQEEVLGRPPFRVVHVERQASFFLTGGLVAVHARDRSRAAIWEALRERRVYGTSGERILLYFDLVAGDAQERPMGSVVRVGTPPAFRVRAAGSFAQRPGCSDEAVAALGADRLERLCGGECYNPSDARHRISRIELVRIRRQRSDAEPVQGLIEDPWRVLTCPAGREVCEVQVSDPELPGEDREVVYYARAIQEPTPGVNASGLRCDEDGCAPCYGDYRTPYEDDCLAPNEERAWSSPIYVTFDPSLAPPSLAPPSLAAVPSDAGAVGGGQP